jgi:hypothetical protein
MLLLLLRQKQCGFIETELRLNKDKKEELSEHIETLQQTLDDVKRKQESRKTSVRAHKTPSTPNVVAAAAAAAEKQTSTKPKSTSSSATSVEKRETLTSSGTKASQGSFTASQLDSIQKVFLYFCMLQSPFAEFLSLSLSKRNLNWFARSLLWSATRRPPYNER